MQSTLESCRALARKNGLSWGLSGDFLYFGCYTFAEYGYAYFGTGGTDKEKLQEMERLSVSHAHPLRLPSLDTDCLVLSNQAKLFQLIQGLPQNPKCSDFPWLECPTANGCTWWGGARCVGTWQPSVAGRDLFKL